MISCYIEVNNSDMKIAMIGQKGMPAIYGGVEQHVHELSLGLVRHGFDVTVYARKWYTGGQATAINGVAIAHLPSLRTKHLDTISHTFIATIHALLNGFDVIHYHGVGPALLSWLPRIVSPRTRVLVTFHSIDRYHKKWGWLAKAALKIGEWAACHFPHETISISRGIKQYCLNEYGVATTYIPYGIANRDQAVPTTPIRMFGLAPDKYVVMISRLVPHKGAHLLIEAFMNLKKTCAADPNIQEFKLAIVGGSVYTDEYVAALHQLAAACRDIVFTGFQSGETVEALYQHAKALVHPSLNEGLPITVLTAMSHKKPALLSNIPEHMELVTDPRCFFHENDVDAIAKTLCDFLHLSAEEQARMGERNRDTIRKQYEWEQLVPKIAEMYRAHAPTVGAVIKSRA